MFKVGILTISDRSSKGIRADESHRVIRESLKTLDHQVTAYEVIPDEADIISHKLTEWADGGSIDVILTTGGTGLAPRDVTPEATLAVLEKVAPGIPEMMRAQTFNITPRAMLSRAAAGSRKECLIVNLPGSPKAVRECLEVILPVMAHTVEVVKGTAIEQSTQAGKKD